MTSLERAERPPVGQDSLLHLREGRSYLVVLLLRERCGQVLCELVEMLADDPADLVARGPVPRGWGAFGRPRSACSPAATPRVPGPGQRATRLRFSGRRTAGRAPRGGRVSRKAEPRLTFSPRRPRPAWPSRPGHRARTVSWWRRIKISAIRHASSHRESRSHDPTRVIRRKTNRRHMTGDHHGQAAGRVQDPV